MLRKSKVKAVPWHSKQALTDIRSTALHIHNLKPWKGIDCQHHTPAALPPRIGTGFPFYRRLDWPRGRFEWVQKISPPPVAFYHRILEYVASYCIDCAIPRLLETIHLQSASAINKQSSQTPKDCLWQYLVTLLRPSCIRQTFRMSFSPVV